LFVVLQQQTDSPGVDVHSF